MQPIQEKTQQKIKIVQLPSGGAVLPDGLLEMKPALGDFIRARPLHHVVERVGRRELAQNHPVRAIRVPRAKKRACE